MRRAMFAVSAAAAMAVAFSIPSALRAHDAGSPRSERGSMIGQGMANTMGQMSQMMNHCNQMMKEASDRPNEQWRDGTPPAGGQTEKNR